VSRLPQLPISLDSVFGASLVPGTFLKRFLDFKRLINKFLESTGHRFAVAIWCRVRVIVHVKIRPREHEFPPPEPA